MTVVSILLSALALQGAKAPDMRVVDVKAAGLSVSIPKQWGLYKREGTMSASAKLPIQGSKLFGRMDIGYVVDESKDVDGFLEAAKSVLTIGGNVIERQWKVDIMGSSLALTRFSKDGITTVRGVLFRPIKNKFVIAVSSPTDDFPKVEPYLLSTLESMREIKAIAPKQPVIATEKKIPIVRNTSTKIPKLPISETLTVNGKNMVLHLPGGTKTSKLGASSVSCSFNGFVGSVIITAYSSEGNPPSTVYQVKAAETSKLFKGAIQRIDESSPFHPDKQIRDYVWRTGLSEKNSSPMMTCDCIITQDKPIFLMAFFSSGNASMFSKERAALTKFLSTIQLSE